MKGQSTSQSTNQYDYKSPPSWAGMDAFNANLSAFDTADPSISYNFANQRSAANNRISNPFGPGISPEVADAMKYQSNEQLNQGQGQALREDSFNRRNAKQSALATGAALTAPSLVQTAGTNNTQSTTPIGPSLISAIGEIGGGALG